MRLTQGQPYRSAAKAAAGGRKPRPIRRTRNGRGTEGCRSTCSTEEAGPGKPGNRAEEKTLRTGRTGEWKHQRLRPRRLRRKHASDRMGVEALRKPDPVTARIVAGGQGRRGREASVTSTLSRHRARRRSQGNRTGASESGATDTERGKPKRWSRPAHNPQGRRSPAIGVKARQSRR